MNEDSYDKTAEEILADIENSELMYKNVNGHILRGDKVLTVEQAVNALNTMRREIAEIDVDIEKCYTVIRDKEALIVELVNNIRDKTRQIRLLNY